MSLFLEPDPRQIDAAAGLKADAVELHTGQYALATGDPQQAVELAELAKAAQQVRSLGLVLHAGHGLTYRNVKPIAAIAGMSELNIGHSIVARAHHGRLRTSGARDEKAGVVTDFSAASEGAPARLAVCVLFAGPDRCMDAGTSASGCFPSFQRVFS